MARQRDEIARLVDCVVDSSKMEQVSDKPFVIVCKVVDLVGHQLRSCHVGVIDSGRSLLLPGGVLHSDEVVNRCGQAYATCGQWQEPKARIGQPTRAPAPVVHDPKGESCSDAPDAWVAWPTGRLVTR